MTGEDVKRLANEMAAAWLRDHQKAEEPREPVHRSRFDYMSPERYQFWVDEHQ